MKYSKKEIAFKALVLFFWMVLICAAESTVFPQLKLFDSVPSCLPFVVCAAAVFDGPWAGLICGFAAGFLADGVGGQSFCLYTIVYLVSGAVIGAVSPELFKKSYLCVLGWGCALYFVAEFLRFFVFFYLFGRADLSAVVSVILPGLLYSALLSPVAAAPSMIMRRFFKTEDPLVR